MSWLAPWFLAGMIGLAAPLFLHFIRRTPQGHQVFSTLMFLRPNPPQIHRRSRLQHWLLLLLRLAAFALIVLAFSRPFWRSESPFPDATPARRYIAVLIDTSASMRQAGLWEQAKTELRRRLEALGPEDHVALLTFDEGLRTIVDFPAVAAADGMPVARPRSMSSPLGLTTRPVFAVEPASDGQSGPNRGGPAAALSALDGLEPTWFATDIATAVADVVQQLEVKAEKSVGELWVVSDFQEGADWGDLRQLAWPPNVVCRAFTVQPKVACQATVRLLDAVEEEDSLEQAAVSLGLHGNAAGKVLELTWHNAQGNVDKPVQLSLANGNRGARVVKLPRPPSATSVTIGGDDDPFGNQFYTAQIRPRQVPMLFVTADAAELPREMFYFWRRAVEELKGFECTVSAIEPAQLAAALQPEAEGQRPELIVVATPLDAASVSVVEEAQQSGIDVLLVISPEQGRMPDWDDVHLSHWGIAAGAAEESTTGRPVAANASLSPASDAAPRDLASMLPAAANPSADVSGGESTVTSSTTTSTTTTTTAATDESVMLESIDYRHAFFARFAEPRFADFTKIHFWRSANLRAPDKAIVLASFDNQRPFLWEERRGKARRWVLAAGWHPRASQFGVSSKFVPWVAGVVEEAAGPARSSRGYVVGQRLDWSDLGLAPDAVLQVTKPNGELWQGAAQDVPTDLLSMPGLFRVVSGDTDLELAVNLLGSELRTASVDVTEWLPDEPAQETAGGDAESAQPDSRLAVEVEGRQRLWQWLLLAAGLMMASETCLASFYDRRLQRELAVETGAE